MPLVFAAGSLESTTNIQASSIIETIEIPAIGGILINEEKTQPEAISDPTEPVKIPIECSCVRYAESKVSGIPIWDAIDYPINTINPKVGDIIKLQYYNATTTKYTYHIAVIKEITEEGYSVTEGNFEKCKESQRVIAKNDDNIVGFFDVILWREIQKLPQDLQDTLKCESNFSHYKQSAVIRGKDGEWGIGQFMKGTWKWFNELRRVDELSMLDILNPYDQIKMMEWAWEKDRAFHWSCYKSPDIVSSTD